MGNTRQGRQGTRPKVNSGVRLRNAVGSSRSSVSADKSVSSPNKLLAAALDAASKLTIPVSNVGACVNLQLGGDRRVLLESLQWCRHRSQAATDAVEHQQTADVHSANQRMTRSELDSTGKQFDVLRPGFKRGLCMTDPSSSGLPRKFSWVKNQLDPSLLDDKLFLYCSPVRFKAIEIPDSAIAPDGTRNIEAQHPEVCDVGFGHSVSFFPIQVSASKLPLTHPRYLDGKGSIRLLPLPNVFCRSLQAHNPNFHQGNGLTMNDQGAQMSKSSLRQIAGVAARKSLSYRSVSDTLKFGSRDQWEAGENHSSEVQDSEWLSSSDIKGLKAISSVSLDSNFDADVGLSASVYVKSVCDILGSSSPVQEVVSESLFEGSSILPSHLIERNQSALGSVNSETLIWKTIFALVPLMEHPDLSVLTHTTYLIAKLLGIVKKTQKTAESELSSQGNPIAQQVVFRILPVCMSLLLCFGDLWHVCSRRKMDTSGRSLLEVRMSLPRLLTLDKDGDETGVLWPAGDIASEADPRLAVFAVIQRCIECTGERGLQFALSLRAYLVLSDDDLDNLRAANGIGDDKVSTTTLKTAHQSHGIVRACTCIFLSDELAEQSFAADSGQQNSSGICSSLIQFVESSWQHFCCGMPPLHASSSTKPVHGRSKHPGVHQSSSSGSSSVRNRQAERLAMKISTATTLSSFLRFLIERAAQTSQQHSKRNAKKMLRDDLSVLPTAWHHFLAYSNDHNIGDNCDENSRLEMARLRFLVHTIIRSQLPGQSAMLNGTGDDIATKRSDPLLALAIDLLEEVSCKAGKLPCPLSSVGEGFPVTIHGLQAKANARLLERDSSKISGIERFMQSLPDKLCLFSLIGFIESASRVRGGALLIAYDPRSLPCLVYWVTAAAMVNSSLDSGLGSSNSPAEWKTALVLCGQRCLDLVNRMWILESAMYNTVRNVLKTHNEGPAGASSLAAGSISNPLHHAAERLLHLKVVQHVSSLHILEHKANPKGSNRAEEETANDQIQKTGVSTALATYLRLREKGQGVASSASSIQLTDAADVSLFSPLALRSLAQTVTCTVLSSALKANNGEVPRCKLPTPPAVLMSSLCGLGYGVESAISQQLGMSIFREAVSRLCAGSRNNLEAGHGNDGNPEVADEETKVSGVHSPFFEHFGETAVDASTLSSLLIPGLAALCRSLISEESSQTLYQHPTALPCVDWAFRLSILCPSICSKFKASELASTFLDGHQDSPEIWGSCTTLHTFCEGRAVFRWFQSIKSSTLVLQGCARRLEARQKYSDALITLHTLKAVSMPAFNKKGKAKKNNKSHASSRKSARSLNQNSQRNSVQGIHSQSSLFSSMKSVASTLPEGQITLSELLWSKLDFDDVADWPALLSSSLKQGAEESDQARHRLKRQTRSLERLMTKNRLKAENGQLKWIGTRKQSEAKGPATANMWQSAASSAVKLEKASKLSLASKFPGQASPLMARALQSSNASSGSGFSRVRAKSILAKSLNAQKGDTVPLSSTTSSDSSSHNSGSDTCGSLHHTQSLEANVHKIVFDPTDLKEGLKPGLKLDPDVLDQAFGNGNSDENSPRGLKLPHFSGMQAPGMSIPTIRTHVHPLCELPPHTFAPKGVSQRDVLKVFGNLDSEDDDDFVPAAGDSDSDTEFAYQMEDTLFFDMADRSFWDIACPAKKLLRDCTDSSASASSNDEKTPFASKYKQSRIPSHTRLAAIRRGIAPSEDDFPRVRVRKFRPSNSACSFLRADEKGQIQAFQKIQEPSRLRMQVIESHLAAESPNVESARSDIESLSGSEPGMNSAEVALSIGNAGPQTLRRQSAFVGGSPQDTVKHAMKNAILSNAQHRSSADGYNGRASTASASPLPSSRHSSMGRANEEEMDSNFSRRRGSSVFALATSRGMQADSALSLQAPQNAARLSDSRSRRTSSIFGNPLGSARLSASPTISAGSRRGSVLDSSRGSRSPKQDTALAIRKAVTKYQITGVSKSNEYHLHCLTVVESLQRETFRWLNSEGCRSILLSHEELAAQVELLCGNIDTPLHDIGALAKFTDKNQNNSEVSSSPLQTMTLSRKQSIALSLAHPQVPTARRSVSSPPLGDFGSTESPIHCNMDELSNTTPTSNTDRLPRSNFSLPSPTHATVPQNLSPLHSSRVGDNVEESGWPQANLYFPGNGTNSSFLADPIASSSLSARATSIFTLPQTKGNVDDHDGMHSTLFEAGNATSSSHIKTLAEKRFASAGLHLRAEPDLINLHMSKIVLQRSEQHGSLTRTKQKKAENRYQDALMFVHENQGRAVMSAHFQLRQCVASLSPLHPTLSSLGNASGAATSAAVGILRDLGELSDWDMTGWEGRNLTAQTHHGNGSNENISQIQFENLLEILVSRAVGQPLRRIDPIQHYSSISSSHNDLSGGIDSSKLAGDEQWSVFNWKDDAVSKSFSMASLVEKLNSSGAESKGLDEMFNDNSGDSASSNSGSEDSSGNDLLRQKKIQTSEDDTGVLSLLSQEAQAHQSARARQLSEKESLRLRLKAEQEVNYKESVAALRKGTLAIAESMVSTGVWNQGLKAGSRKSKPSGIGQLLRIAIFKLVRHPVHLTSDDVFTKMKAKLAEERVLKLQERAQSVAQFINQNVKHTKTNDLVKESNKRRELDLLSHELGLGIAGEGGEQVEYDDVKSEILFAAVLATCRRAAKLLSNDPDASTRLFNYALRICSPLSAFDFSKKTQAFLCVCSAIGRCHMKSLHACRAAQCAAVGMSALVDDDSLLALRAIVGARRVAFSRLSSEKLSQSNSSIARKLANLGRSKTTNSITQIPDYSFFERIDPARMILSTDASHSLPLAELQNETYLQKIDVSLGNIIREQTSNLTRRGHLPRRIEQIGLRDSHVYLTPKFSELVDYFMKVGRTNGLMALDSGHDLESPLLSGLYSRAGMASSDPVAVAIHDRATEVTLINLHFAVQRSAGLSSQGRLKEAMSLMRHVIASPTIRSTVSTLLDLGLRRGLLLGNGTSQKIVTKLPQGPAWLLGMCSAALLTWHDVIIVMSVCLCQIGSWDKAFSILMPWVAAIYVGDTSTIPSTGGGFPSILDLCRVKPSELHPWLGAKSRKRLLQVVKIAMSLQRLCSKLSNFSIISRAKPLSKAKARDEQRSRQSNINSLVSSTPSSSERGPSSVAKAQTDSAVSAAAGACFSHLVGSIFVHDSDVEASSSSSDASSSTCDSDDSTDSVADILRQDRRQQRLVQSLYGDWSTETPATDFIRGHRPPHLVERLLPNRKKTGESDSSSSDDAAVKRPQKGSRKVDSMPMTSNEEERIAKEAELQAEAATAAEPEDEPKKDKPRVLAQLRVQTEGLPSNLKQPPETAGARLIHGQEGSPLLTPFQKNGGGLRTPGAATVGTGANHPLMRMRQQRGNQSTSGHTLAMNNSTMLGNGWQASASEVDSVWQQWKQGKLGLTGKAPKGILARSMSIMSAHDEASEDESSKTKPKPRKKPGFRPRSANGHFGVPVWDALLDEFDHDEHRPGEGSAQGFNMRNSSNGKTQSASVASSSSSPWGSRARPKSASNNSTNLRSKHSNHTMKDTASGTVQILTDILPRTRFKHVANQAGPTIGKDHRDNSWMAAPDTAAPTPPRKLPISARHLHTQDLAKRKLQSKMDTQGRPDTFSDF